MANVVDSELDRIALEARNSENPDLLGVYDEFEHVLGLGFVACQTYIVSKLKGKVSKRKGKNKTQLLSLGPMHRSQQSFALVINACANYWKHHDEWDGASLGNREKTTISVLEKMGADVWSEYPTSKVMHALLSPHEKRFKKLLPFLKQWAENAHNAI